MRNTQSLLESRPKGSSELSGVDELSPNALGVSSDTLEVHKKISSIAIDFRRAYGRTVEIKIFERSANRFVEVFMRSRRRSTAVPGELVPEFRVNGVKVFLGIPQSFSQLDEAIDRSFGRPVKD
ncbi:MAG: hypothetical protein ACYC7D_09940 [Nitrososphaerales archaeon]